MLIRLRTLALLPFLIACGELSDPIDPVAPSLAVASNANPRYIVVLREDVVGVRSVSAAMTAAHATSAEFVYTASIKGFAARLSPQAAQALRRDARVLMVSQEKVVRIDGTQTPTPSWGLDRIDQRDLPLDDSYTYPRSGFGVHFYGIDTGILTTHVEFTGRSEPGYSAFNDANGTTDCNGHGTHTASTAAGTTYGVAKGMTVVPVRVIDCSGVGTTTEIIAGVDWVTANAVFPAVANMSLGLFADAATDLAVANSIAAGVVYTVAAGNKDTDACFFSPADVPGAITVGATESADFRAAFSNYGTCVDVFAPGVGITGAWIGSNTATNTIDGTSMASPHVAGAAGLYLEAHSSALPSEVAAAVSSNATANKILNPGSGSPNLVLYTGFIPVNIPPVADFTWSCVSHVCTVDGSASHDPDGNIVSYTWRVDKSKKTMTGPVLTMTMNGNRARDVTLTVVDNSRAAGSITIVVQP